MDKKRNDHSTAESTAYGDLQTAFELLIETAQSGDFPKQWIIRILESLNSLLQNGDFPKKLAIEMNIFIAEIIGEYPEPEEAGTQITPNLEVKKISTPAIELPICKKIGTKNKSEVFSVERRNQPAKMEKTREKLPVPAEFSQIATRVELCPIEGEIKKFETSPIKTLLNVLSDPGFPIKTELWGEISKSELLKIRSRSKSLEKIVVLENEKRISCKDEQVVYNMLFMAGSNQSIFIWGGETVCFWNNPGQKMEHVLTTEGIEVADLRYLIIVSQCSNEKITLELMQFTH